MFHGMFEAQSFVIGLVINNLFQVLGRRYRLLCELEAGHSKECITHASGARRRSTAVSSRLFALFDHVNLTFDLLT